MKKNIDSVSTMARDRGQVHVALMGGLGCALAAMTFLIPWYRIDYFDYMNPDSATRYECYLGFSQYPMLEEIDYLMSGLMILMVISLVASVCAAALPLLVRGALGMVISAASTGLLVASAVLFYVGVTGPLDHFSGVTMLNRSLWVETAPMIGFWILIAAAASLGTYTVLLVRFDKKKGFSFGQSPAD